MAEFVSALVSTVSSDKELVILQQLNTALSRWRCGDDELLPPFLDEDDFPGILLGHLFVQSIPLNSLKHVQIIHQNSGRSREDSGGPLETPLPL